MTSRAAEYRWANERRVNGMPTPEELEAEGYTRVRRHPFWLASVLMKRDTEEEMPDGDV